MTQSLGVSGVVDGQGWWPAVFHPPPNPSLTASATVPGATDESTPSLHHDAKENAESMSGPGLSESTSQAFPQAGAVSTKEAVVDLAQPRDQSDSSWPNGTNAGFWQNVAGDPSEPAVFDNAPSRELPVAHMRVHFQDFAAQLRLQRHHEHRKRILFCRKRHLQNSVALSARLRRVAAWVHAGLVQISTQGDSQCFSRVHQHIQDLTDLCFSHWSHTMQALETSSPFNPPQHPSFLSKLPQTSRRDCLEFIQTLRAKPRFLIDKFKAMSPAQISALSTFPRYSELSDSVLSSLSQNRGRNSQRKRIKAFSKELEEYASSFERSNPLSFLLHNVYGSSGDVDNCEGQLRISTWSSICANLMMEAESAYDSIISHVLSAFASLYDWQIKDRLELFLTRILQEGAFLLDRPELAASTSQFEFVGNLDAFSTPQAHDLFDDAVRDLLALLACHAGIPTGALQLARAIMAKLPTPDAQRRFKGEFLFKWFMRDFLRNALEFPEDEAMLLQFHISDKKRAMLLHHLYDRTSSRAADVYSPMRSQPIDPAVHYYVDSLIDQVYPVDYYTDPYDASNAQKSRTSRSNASYLSICAADIAHILDSLRPQYIHTSSPWDSILSSSLSAFSMQYSSSRVGGKFDKLRGFVLDTMDPGLSSKNIHPCQEHWATLVVTNTGQVEQALDSWSPDDRRIDFSKELDPAQAAAVQLAESSFPAFQQSSISGSVDYESSLDEMFAQKRRMALIKANSIAAMYWHDAQECLKLHYPLTLLTGDDTKVLSPVTKLIKLSDGVLSDACVEMEQEVAELEEVYADVRAKINSLMVQMDKLRVKIWYTMNVVTSIEYEGAKNVSTALLNMALSSSTFNQGQGFPGPSRPSTSGTSTSSMFDQPRIDTMSILKASKEHGGPRKLSDPQIDMTKKWLKRVDNFCKGEERIHRFCMEVKVATKKLVGETITDSPVLWSSELFAREKLLYGEQAGPLYSAQPSTRAPSVMSEPLSSSPFPSRFGPIAFRGSLYSQTSSRTGSDLASLISFPGRAPTVTTVDSGNTIFSPPQSNTRSATSISSRSRPASMFEGGALSRMMEHGVEKAGFLAGLQQNLICLLLSDLGCLVWSRGSETDTWMSTVRNTPSVTDRLRQRAAMACLMLDGETKIAAVHSASGGKKKHVWKRSLSAAPSSPARGSCRAAGTDEIEILFKEESEGEMHGRFTFHGAFADVLARVSQHVDPNLKLQAICDFEKLSLVLQKSLTARRIPEAEREEGVRRRSLDARLLSANLKKEQSSHTVGSPSSESDPVQFLKRLLSILAPETIFRDLQYISAFVSSQTLADTDMGRSFLQVGLASLAWKDEVCRGMVDVADRMMVKDSARRDTSIEADRDAPIVKAAEYWMIAAREGNAIAQRELASLYLTHPDSTPIVSMPFAQASDIFKSEMMWAEEGATLARHGNQALCLALHWMQVAASNGDEVAQMKLNERRASRSTR